MNFSILTYFSKDLNLKNKINNLFRNKVGEITKILLVTNFKTTFMHTSCI